MAVKLLVGKDDYYSFKMIKLITDLVYQSE